ncbi:Spermatogenesis-associated protein 1 [Collichthys lucidus]|uniref:Spermatogenesis-associated protein 1 n=1 Tax=Collichthys lucidus TaxID=240159 RepID=A0A4U5UIR1_COLLU|nr:Spermatogenesis-associated protein 1 [Collichthys lucidus]
MELSCESVRYPEERRPASCKYVELHVLYVPDDQWDGKLNKVPAEAIESFISAGFIRSELGALLGAERSIDKFSFLKCVGRSLALAPQPELYLLPTVENDSSVCSQSLSPDTSSSSPDQQTYYHPPKTCSLPAGTKEPIKFPLIPQCSQQPPPTPGLEDEEDEEDEEQSYGSSEAEGENEEEGGSSNKFEWAKQECCPRLPQNQRAPQPVSQNKASQRHEAESAQVKELPEREETCRKKKQHHRENRAARDSGVAQSLEDRDSNCSLTDGLGKSKDALKSIRNKATREELIEDIKLVREERKQLEWTRQELLRKGKDLLAQNRHRRNQARDSWKKKYFETKKATAPLEENLRNLRQELETFYNKLLHQLQARDNRGKPRRQGRSSIKNELIIQIMTESHEIDNLKRKVEDAKMKLVTEIKLRKQAATELRALKAELAQKKSQSSHPGPTASIGFGNTTRDKPQIQSTST